MYFCLDLVSLQVGNLSENHTLARNIDKNNNDIGSGIEQPHLPPTKDEEPHLPMKNLIRIMRRALPENAKITDDAKKSIQLCVTEFIAIITIEANERCKAEHRKIINGDDLIWAMNMLGFEDYGGLLAIFLENYRHHEAQFNFMPIDYGFNKDESSASGSGCGSNNGQC
ncbi:hypothetical protein TSUD_14530 [Trifolium subterraneum]|uniref:Transcription factor CBF/NF-Y/archaeal histone domain-containing protein n=1 Tax=Trifolium subterraneum TaxID=3900 RepID=A0A2Z6MBL5_TRISU|nr:hypothetical protein TSUD_14530 [Trifolium subterraneum]